MSATIKTFRAPDARSVLALVKAELGPEAIILSTREVTSGILRRTEIEVTAGMPSVDAPRPVAAAAAYGAKAPKAPVENTDDDESVAAPKPSAKPASKSSTNSVKDSTPATNKVSDAAKKPATGATATSTHQAADFEKARELPRATEPVAAGFQTSAERYFSDREETPVMSEIALLRSELDTVRRELRQRKQTQSENLPSNLPRAARALRSHLIDRGAEASLASELIGQALDTASGTSFPTVARALRDVVSERIIGSRAPWTSDRRQTVAFVGPTGAGKTTTLAKIAARALLEGRRKVAFITLDTYRIGASEQIARYGEIMRSPTYVAHSRDELLGALNATMNADLVLIDTAGRSLSEAVAKQAEDLRTIPGIELYLCASAVGSPADLRRVGERYRGLTPSRLILTKLDESASPLGALSLMNEIGRPIAAICDGQRVPEDIHCLSNEALFQRLVGDFSDAQGYEANVR